MMFHHVNNDQVKEDTFLTNKVKSKTSVAYIAVSRISLPLWIRMLCISVVYFCSLGTGKLNLCMLFIELIVGFFQSKLLKTIKIQAAHRYK